MKKVLFPILALVLALGMMPMAFVSAANGPIPPEVPGTVFAYIPNSNEASVSKVDVVANTEVARYSTIPHRTTPDYSPITFYRPVRLVVDSGGNAWALNTMSYEPDLAANPDAQGSVARISSTPVGADNTSTSGGLGGIVEDDDRVSFFDVGGLGDAPRSISIVEEGGEVYLWIGFYVGHYFQKYHYDTSGVPVLVAVGASIDVGDYTPYYTIIDDGYMWVSSRDSGYPTAGINGILLIDINTLAWIVVPYDIIATAGRDIPYALHISPSDGRCWVSDSGEPWPRYRTFVVYTRDGLSITATEEVPVGIAEYPSMCGFTELDGDIWATEFGGNVLKGTYNGSWTFTSMLNLGSGLTWLTGISQDPFGDLWVVSWDHDKLYKFDPNAIGTPIEVPVGDGPYAYALAVVPPTTSELCGVKYLAGTEEGLEGWEIILEKWAVDAWVEVTRMDTDADGKYCFEDLQAGDYRVSETVKDGWVQVSPYDVTQVGDEWVHLLTLPDDASDCEIGPFYNFENEASIEVEKDYRYTNVCFERDNDLDGLIDEDPVDCPLGTDLGYLLPMDNGNYQLEAVIHPKNGKVSSYNPGQYYAVSTVTVLDDVDKLTIVEDWSACAADPISVLNPKKGGGSVVIVQVGPGDDVAYQILDATSDAVTISGNTATAVLEDVAAGTTILMYVKFGPGLKGETWAGPYRPCINYNMASTLADPDPRELGDWIVASANLIVVEKD